MEPESLSNQSPVSSSSFQPKSSFFLFFTTILVFLLPKSCLYSAQTNLVMNSKSYWDQKSMDSSCFQPKCSSFFLLFTILISLLPRSSCLQFTNQSGDEHQILLGLERYWGRSPVLGRWTSLLLTTVNGEELHAKMVWSLPFPFHGKPLGNQSHRPFASSRILPTWTSPTITSPLHSLPYSTIAPI